VALLGTRSRVSLVCEMEKSLEIIMTDHGLFYRSQFESEATFEKAILEIQGELFGKNRMYLDVKKRSASRVA
jgi:hypothetical protein